MSAPALHDRFVKRLYGGLLLLYPPDFRARFGPEMLQAFDDAHAFDSQDGDFGKRFEFWLRTFCDLLRSLGNEWGEVLPKADRIASSAVTFVESLFIPTALCGILTLAGFTTATLSRRGLPPGFGTPVTEWQSTVFALEEGAMVMLLLGVASILGACLMARRQTTRGIWIKL